MSFMNHGSARGLEISREQRDKGKINTYDVG
jgi:hypothetical protein